MTKAAGPGRRSRPLFPVTNENWQAPDAIGWSFSHVDEVLPTAEIQRGGPSFPLPEGPIDLLGLEVPLWTGGRRTVAEIIAETDTDGWLVLHDNRIVAEEYADGMTPATRHLLQSVSKSLVSTVLGALVGRELIDLGAPVAAYVPELADSGYAAATVRQVLDMRSGVGFREDYFDPGSDSRVLEATVGWAPLPDRTAAPRSMKDFLCSLRQVRPHGGRFEYRSCETDVLGWVCEGATGRPFPHVASEVLWSRIGAEHDAYICVDSFGTGVFDGGICATLRDLARFGAVIIGGGRSLTGEQVVPAAWVDDIFTGAEDGVGAFAESPVDNQMPGGMYRSQFWFPSASRDVAVCLGIHGQMIYLDRATHTVCVKLSSWPEPQDLWRSAATLSMFAAISAHLKVRSN